MIEFSDDLLIHGIEGDIGSRMVGAVYETSMEWRYFYQYNVNDLAYFTLIAHKEPICFGPYTVICLSYV